MLLQYNNLSIMAWKSSWVHWQAGSIAVDPLSLTTFLQLRQPKGACLNRHSKTEHTPEHPRAFCKALSDLYDTVGMGSSKVPQLCSGQEESADCLERLSGRQYRNEVASFGLTLRIFGLIRGQRELPPDRLAQLIFEPGLSTGETESQVSGRGMGMYAVRCLARRLGGDIRVELAPDRHSNAVRFIIEIPADRVTELRPRICSMKVS
jgi:hypothetical protein